MSLGAVTCLTSVDCVTRPLSEATHLQQEQEIRADITLQAQHS